MATEEFSFPATTDLFPGGIDSPPLWRLSPVVSPDIFLDRKASTREEEEEDDDDDDENGDEEEDCFPNIPDKHQEKKSFPYVEKGSKLSKKLVAEDEEEKMDLLWEDFNEELPRSRSSRSSGDMLELGCAPQALKLSKSNVAMFSARRPGMLVFMRVLRKLFLLHNSRQSVKNRTWKTP